MTEETKENDLQSLCKFEREILAEVAGLRAPRPWGAAVGAALMYLKQCGYLDGGALTDRGLAVLKEDVR